MNRWCVVSLDGSLRVKTYAKLNLYLKVFPLRSDGFHDIVSIMQTVDLADELTFIQKGDDLLIECDDPGVPTDGRNIIAKVHGYLKEKFPDVVRGAQVKLQKNIPHQSGLAGGSGNAAGAIIALKELFKLPLDDLDMLKCAVAVGSDVPFMLKGGCAIVRGRGEFVDKLPGLAGTFYIIVVPSGKGVETADAYRKLDEWRDSKDHNIGNVDEVYNEAHSIWLSAIGSGDFQGLLHNDFEESIFAACPDIAEVRESLSRLGAKAFMTGSGSAVFAPIDDYNRGLELLERMREAHGDQVYLCNTVPQGVELSD